MSHLTPPEPDPLQAIAARPDLQASTKARYQRELSRYLNTGASLTDSTALASYAAGLSDSGRSFLKAAVKLWADELAAQTKAGATPANVAAVQATVFRLEALAEAIATKQQTGQKMHAWLNQAEVKKLLATCSPNTTTGRRDKIVLGLLVGAGLRREELAGLTFETVQLQPVGGRFRTVLNITGKGAKDRIVPISDRLAAALDAWRAVAGGGYVARSVSRGGLLGESISAVGIFHIVRRAGGRIDKPGLAPHDLRRTFAQLGYEAGVSVAQISTLLGHSSIATTQRYLNLDIDLESTVSDFVPFE